MSDTRRTAGPVTLDELDAPPPISPLVADLIEANLAASHATTNSLIDGLTDQAAKAEATVAAIRHGVTGLLSGPYMPTPDAIRRVLYPPSDLVDWFRREESR